LSFDEVREVDAVEWLSAASRTTAQAEEIRRTNVTPIMLPEVPVDGQVSLHAGSFADRFLYVRRVAG
jgi:hypothetical protein